MKQPILPPQPTDTKSFNLSDFLVSNEVFHMARVSISTRKDLSYHSHNYAELLWIEEGEGIHHINGQKVNVKRNEMIMIRPNDEHSFSSYGKSLVLVNIAFSIETLDYLRNRYFTHSNLYFWSPNKLPYHITISDNLIKRISSRAEEAMRFQRNNIQLDSLLLFIFRNLQEYEAETNRAKEPSWLLAAIRKFNQVNNLRKGNTAFVALCDRNPDYVNRVVKECYQQTLTDLVNDIRIKHAANQLILTNTPIKSIAHACGFTSLAAFYKQFNIRYKQTPLEYRKLHQAIV